MTAFSFSSFDPAEYFKYRPHYPQKLFDLIFSYHQANSNTTSSITSSTSRAIDIACGCGQGSFPLTTKFDSVIGIEPSDEMLSIANSLKNQDYHFIFNLEKIKSNRKAADIRFIKGFAERLDLDDESVDLILSTVGANWFDWFSDSKENPVWKEFHRVLKPGGTVALVLILYKFSYPKIVKTKTKKGYSCWITKDFPLLNSSIPRVDFLISEKEEGTITSKSLESTRIVNSFYDEIPDPPKEKFNHEKTLRLKFDHLKAQDYDEMIQTRKSDEIPSYMKNILAINDQEDSKLEERKNRKENGIENDGNESIFPTPLKKIMKLSEFVDSMRTQSRFIRFYKENPKEKEKVSERDDILWRSAKEAQLKQALLDSKEKGFNLKEGDLELDDFLWDWEKEVEVIYPMVIFLSSKKS